MQEGVWHCTLYTFTLHRMGSGKLYSDRILLYGCTASHSRYHLVCRVSIHDTLLSFQASYQPALHFAPPLMATVMHIAQLPSKRHLPKLHTIDATFLLLFNTQSFEQMDKSGGLLTCNTQALLFGLIWSEFPG